MDQRGNVPQYDAECFGVVVEAHGRPQVPGKLPLGRQADAERLMVSADRLSLTLEEIILGIRTATDNPREFFGEGLAFNEHSDIVDQSGNEDFIGHRRMGRELGKAPCAHRHRDTMPPEIRGTELLGDTLTLEQPRD